MMTQAAHSLPDAVRALAQELYDDFCAVMKRQTGARVVAVRLVEPLEAVIDVDDGAPSIRVCGRGAYLLKKSWAAVGQRKGSDGK
jgi:hypothetical protein